MADVPSFDEDEQMQELLADLPKAWALREDENEFALVLAYLRAAYGRGYVLGLEERTS